MRFLISLTCVTLLLALIIGCNQRSSLDRIILEGNVICGGEKVSSGTVRFVPIDGTKGPMTVTLIIDGHYRTLNRGGVPLGKHRIEIQAQRATGEKIESPDGKMIDRTVPIGDKKYAGKDSPLTIEVTAESDNQIDFKIPE